MAAAGERVNILLVDDDPRNLLALTAILERPDYNLVTASSGAEALNLLLRDEFALILLDVSMPGMDGFEVASVIKTREKSREIPILFVTAIAKDIRDIYRGYSVGAVDYIQKPLDPAVVRAKVAVFVELYRARERIAAQAELIRQSERADSLQREQAARMQAEAATQRFYDLINWVDHAVLWEYDAIARRFAFVSRRSSEILGYPPEEWVGDPRFFIDHVHPDDRADVKSVIEEAIQGKDGRCEHRFYNASNQLVWLHTGINPKKDATGRVELLWGLCLDISGVKRAEQRHRFLSRASALLTESLDYEENLLRLSRLLVPSIADVCSIDVLESNEELSRMVLAASPEIEALTSALQRKAPAPASPDSPIARVVQEGEPLLASTVPDSLLEAIATDEEHLHILREMKLVSLIIVPLRTRRGTLGTLSLSSTDPRRPFREDDLKFAEELAWHAALAVENSRLYSKAQHAIKMRDEVLGVVSHDLKTPLTSIAMSLQMIVRGGRADPKEKAAGALRSVDRMNRMIRDLLDLARIDSAELSFHIETHEANALLSEALEAMREIAAQKSITVKMATSQSPIPVLCDRDRVQQVLSNIIGNALKFTPPGGTVELSVKPVRETNEAEFCIADSGPGIPANALPHIFERYWQANDTRGKAEGVGLGLFISKKLIESQGGRIWAQSPPGHGATFRFTLPMKPTTST